MASANPHPSSDKRHQDGQKERQLAIAEAVIKKELEKLTAEA